MFLKMKVVRKLVLATALIVPMTSVGAVATPAAAIGESADQGFYRCGRTHWQKYNVVQHEVRKSRMSGTWVREKWYVGSLYAHNYATTTYCR